MNSCYRTLKDAHEVRQLNALQMAYLGDSVWELIVRNNLISSGYNVHHMHQKCVSLVNAHSQAQMIQYLTDYLTEEEKDVVRRGRNSHPKHNVARNQDPDEYSASTGFEALIGFLFMTGNDQRLEEIVNCLKEVKMIG